MVQNNGCMSKVSKGSLRIIGGVHRGRRLHFIAPEGLRPTIDRVRETLFNWLQTHVEGARVLDLFAGSGALGFEAVSRGASEIVLVEANRKVAALLEKNAALLTTESAKPHIEVCHTDAQDFLGKQGKRFDIVFLDPPFRCNLLQPVIELLESKDRLSPKALIYLEQASDEDEPHLPVNWRVIRDKQAGQVRYCLIERSSNDSQ